MTYRALALRRWPDAEWVSGEGPYALVAPCGVVTITLHKTLDSAERYKVPIDSTGCGHACRPGAPHDIIDLAAHQ